MPRASASRASRPVLEASPILAIRCPLTSRATTSRTVMPSARAAKVSAMRCCSTGSASARHVVDRRREPAVIERAGAGAQHQRLAGARAGTPGDVLVGLGVALAGAGRADQLEDRLDHAFGDRHAADQRLDLLQPLGGRARSAALRFLDAGGLEQDAPLGVEVGIEDVDLHQEAVELRLGQRIGAFLLQRVLRRQHVEGRGQVVALRRRP